MSDWQPIETAPKAAQRIDIWAKRWRSEYDDFVGQRFVDCSWDQGDAMTNRRAKWFGVHEGWKPTHWMPLPDPPKEGAA